MGVGYDNHKTTGRKEIISRIEMYGHGAGYTSEEVYDLAVLALNLSNITNMKDTGLILAVATHSGRTAVLT